MAMPFARRLDAVARELASKKGSGRWCGSRIAAAERAILDRIPLVDLVLEVRDARVCSSLSLFCCLLVLLSYSLVFIMLLFAWMI